MMGLKDNIIARLLRHFTWRQRWRERFRSRESVPVRKIFESHYEGFSFAEVRDLWAEIAFHLDIDPEKLSPTDRFDEHLRPEEGMELMSPLEDLTFFVRIEAEKRGVELDIAKLCCIDDVVKLLLRKCAPN